ncbi:aminotransferase class I/II-fold pyridoxal phosphate-dependent enzyme [Thermosediminibacter litoriperuensis]|uniref:Lysine decarboxylase n=1 Tax=Thermosediminibacter litoriperuensis TaxID=291989 RepID=A0A5S5AW44_9FIRM|nr:aminotransferase class V-fold PLP-dependent enzyme [Thermosediminibacter litoriperuensis]TYP57393.1 lysine decarboxylase [Thermosediminibacter litoriperuensis]
MKKKVSMPLVEKLIAYSGKGPVRFHMPGHKGGKGLPQRLRVIMEKNLFRWDMTEIPGLDNWHDPQGAIEEAQRLLAELYGADRSFFLVNGSTSGVMAMLGAALEKGGEVLLPRNSHKAALMGVILTGAKPVYLKPQVDGELGVATGVPLSEWRKALEQHPDAKAVFITNPTYQGFCPNLSGILSKAKARGMKVLVDEAHGAHLAFSKRLPSSAGEFEVDAWVQSPHKMLCSLTQSAWLHLKGRGLDRERLRSYLSLLTSTSPSYILMASLDAARAVMETRGRWWVEKGLELAERARKLINQKTHFYCVGREARGRGGVYDVDLSRLMVNVSPAGYTGFFVEKVLRERFNIYAEYADFSNVYFLLTGGNTWDDVAKLVRALKRFPARKKKLKPVCFPADLPARALDPGEAFFSPAERVHLDAAPGRIIRDSVIPYPPGVPLLCPGEIVEKQHVEVIREILRAGGYCQGIKNGCITVVKNG